MPSTSKQLSEMIANDLPIPIPTLVTAGFASRTTIWRFARDGMPVTRIGRRIFVKFSDLVNASGATLMPPPGQISKTNPEI